MRPSGNTLTNAPVQDVNVSGKNWVTCLNDHDQLKDLLARLFSQ